MNSSPDSRNYNIDLHIEELVLDGFPEGDSYRIARAIEQELGRLMSRDGLPGTLMQDRNMARLDGGSLDLESGASPEETGRLAALNLYGGMKQ